MGLTKQVGQSVVSGMRVIGIMSLSRGKEDEKRITKKGIQLARKVVSRLQHSSPSSPLLSDLDQDPFFLNEAILIQASLDPFSFECKRFFPLIPREVRRKRLEEERKKESIIFLI